MLTDNIIKIEREIKDAFSRILGDVYMGNVSVQGLLAMCAKATFSNERVDLSRAQQKLISYFGSPEAIMRFSQINVLSQLVFDKSDNYKDVIIGANKTKLVSMVNRIANEINLLLKNESGTLENISEQLDKYVSIVVSSLNELNHIIKSKSCSIVDKQFNSFKNNIYKIIDNDEISLQSKKSRVNSLKNSLKYTIPQELNNMLIDELNKKKQKIENKRKTFDEQVRISQMSLSISNGIIANIDFSGALDELDNTIGDYVGSTVAGAAGGAGLGFAIGSVVPVIGNIIGAAVGAAVGGISGAVSRSFHDGSSNAKFEVDRAIEENKRQVLSLIDDNMSEIKDMINNAIENTKIAVNNEKKRIQSTITVINDAKRRLFNFRNIVKLS